MHRAIASKSNRPATPGKRGRRTVPIEVFCLKYLENNAQIRPTAKALKISVHTIYRFLERKDIDEYMSKARETLVSAIAAQSAKKYTLDRSDLDTRLIRTLDSPKVATPTTAAMVIAIKETLEIGYDSLGFGKAPNVVNNNAIAAVAASDMAKDVYEAMWLRERKAGWAKELEQKHGNPSQLPPG